MSAEPQKKTRAPRAWSIAPADVRHYSQAIYAVATTHPWPWKRDRQLDPFKLRVPENDDELLPPELLQHFITTNFITEAQQLVKARVRKAKHREKAKPVCVHLDVEAWELLADYAKSNNLTLSQAVKDRFEDEPKSS